MTQYERPDVGELNGLDEIERHPGRRCSAGRLRGDRGWSLPPGGADQSALERLRDIAIIFIVLLGAVTVVLLAGITVALILVFMQLKDNALPILDETSETIKRVRGTANFVSEEAVKPIMTVAGKAAKVRAMSQVLAGKRKTPPMG